MPTVIEVFADITCPFTHVGLARVATLTAEAQGSIEIWVRAWPLEWVNGVPMRPRPVAAKGDLLRRELGIDQFSGINPQQWPSTTIPALNLAALAREAGTATGLTVSLEVRDALFEKGLDISNPDVLAEIASRHGLPVPDEEASEAVLADYEEGQRRGVRGSPDFFVGDDEFYCPALNLSHDEAGKLTAQFDADGLEAFMSRVIADLASPPDLDAG